MTRAVSIAEIMIVRRSMPNLLRALASHFIKKKALKQEVKVPPTMANPIYLYAWFILAMRSSEMP
jgi:hypothetical protein